MYGVCCGNSICHSAFTASKYNEPMKNLLMVSTLLLLTACSGSQYPNNIKPVTGFELDRYLGTWYEIARLDHSFERGLEQVSASYSMRDDGGVKVLNRGFNTDDQEWSESVGKAYFVQDESTGHLKVSFFGPFYGSYVIFQLADDYQHAFISGGDYDYLWFLSRTPQVSAKLKTEFVQLATEKGYRVEELIWVDQSAK